MMSKEKLFVLFMDNPQIGLTHGPQIQLVTLEMLEKRPGFLCGDTEAIAELGVEDVWRDRSNPDAIKVIRVK